MDSGRETDPEPSPVGSAGKPVSRRRVVVVLGMHRSGTSALARMLSVLGVALPKTPMGPSRGNEHGHWGESDPIRWLHEELLRAAGSSWDDVSPFPASWLDTNAADGYRAQLVSLLLDEYPGSDTFVVKDPRISRFVPFWTRVLDDLGVDAGYLLALRNPLEVAASLAHRNGFGHSKTLLLWLRHTLDAERETREQRRVLVSYAGLLRDWRATADEISSRLDLEWTRTGHGVSAEIGRSLSAAQRHHEFSIDELNARDDIVAWVQEAYAVLLEAWESKQSPDTERLDAVNSALADADLAYGDVLAESQLETAELGERLDRERASFEDTRRAQRAMRVQLDALTTRVDELRRKAEARASAARQREAELRRELRETNQVLAELRASGLRQLLGRRYRSARQLGSWLVNPRLPGRPRNAREFLVLRRSNLFDSAGYLRRNPGRRERRNESADALHRARRANRPEPQLLVRHGRLFRPASGPARQRRQPALPLLPFRRRPRDDGVARPASSRKLGMDTGRRTGPDPPGGALGGGGRGGAQASGGEAADGLGGRAHPQPSLRVAGRVAFGAQTVVPTARGDRQRRREHGRDGIDAADRVPR